MAFFDGLSSLFSSNPQAHGGLSSMFAGTRSNGLTGLLSDLGIIPPIPTQEQYSGMMGQLFGQRAPNDQMYANSDSNKAPQLGDNGTPLSSFGSMSGGIVPGDTASKVAGLYANLPPQLGVPALLQLAGKFTDPKEGYTLNPGQARFGANNNMVASNTDESYDVSKGVPLPGGKFLVMGSRGTPKILGGDLAPLVKGEAQAPGSPIVNPYTGGQIAAAPQGFKTLTPAALGLAPNAIGPDTIIQQSPTGELIIKKAGDMKSPGAVQQERDTAALNNPANPILQKILNGVPLTDAENKVLLTEKPGAAATNDDAVSHTAQAIAKYQLAPLSGFAMRSPFGQSVMAKVTELNPDYQTQNFTKSQAGYKAFASGKQGDQMRFADNAIGHMNTALQLADALGNGNFPLFNRVGQAYAQQTGSAAPTNFDTAKQIIAGEVVKAITGAGGALADRQEAENAFSKASSPAQLKGAIQTAQTLLARQLQGLGRQYKNSTMRDDFASLISPEAAALLQGANAPAAGGFKYLGKE